MTKPQSLYAPAFLLSYVHDAKLGNAEICYVDLWKRKQKQNKNALVM